MMARELDRWDRGDRWSEGTEGTEGTEGRWPALRGQMAGITKWQKVDITWAEGRHY